MYVSSFPIDLWVMELKPSVAKSELVLSEIKDVEGDGFFVMFEIHGESDGVSNVTNLVKGLVGVVGGDGFYKKRGWESKIVYNLLMNEVSGSTTIDQGRKSVLVLSTHEAYFDVDF